MLLRIKIFLLLLSLIFLLREHDFITKKSLTYDEHLHISHGYPIIKTSSYELKGYNTLMMPHLISIPLFFLNLQPFENWDSYKKAKIDKYSWEFGLDFVYHNNIPAEKIIFLSRLPIVIVSLLGGFFIFLWTRKLYNETIALLSFIIYTFSPNILAHSGLATEDLTFTFFGFVTTYFLWNSLRNPTNLNFFLMGLSFSATLNTKHTAIFFIPIFFILTFFNLKKKIKLTNILAFICGFFLVFIIIYKIIYVKEYFSSLKSTLNYLKRGQVTFLLGQYSPTGFPHYFVVAFLLKTPLPLLLLLILSLFILDFKKNESFLILPPILFLLFASFSKFQIGHRHILPIYPFLFVLASKTLYELIKHKKFFFKISGFIFLFYYLFSSVKIHPHYLAYFNELAGGPKNGYKYLLDSNIDWGQDLNGLKNYISKNKISDIILSYYGSSIVDKVGFQFQDLFSFGIWGNKNHLNQLSPHKEIIAISVTNLQGLYFGKIGHNIFYWLKEKKPIANIGFSIYIYDITNDEFAHQRLSHIYFSVGQYPQAIRQANRTLLLNPKNAFAHLILSFIYHDESNAFKEFKIATNLKPDLDFGYKGFINFYSKKIYIESFNRMKNICLKNNFLTGIEKIDKILNLL